MLSFSRSAKKFSRTAQISLLTLILIVAQLACSTGTTPSPTRDVGEEQTRVAFGVASTSYALQQTEDALKQLTPEPQNGPGADELKATEMSVLLTQQAVQQISTPVPTYTPYPTYTAVANAPTPDVQSQINNANILLFEDTINEGFWIEDTLKMMGLKYRQTEDYSGNFMQELNSGKKWDLIIVGAEAKTKIQGEFWDQILAQSHKKVAVIAEVWYLDRLGGGKIHNFLSECGVAYSSDWPLAESIYWWEPDSPVFNQPNTVLPLLHYSRYWTEEAGDKIRLASGGDAEMIAGITSQKKTTSSGMIATCMGGRTIVQTFSNHDFHKSDIMDLWENYITYTLTNHFAAISQ